VAAIVTNALATVEWQILRYPCRTAVDKLPARMPQFCRAIKRVRQRNESTLNVPVRRPEGLGARPIDPIDRVAERLAERLAGRAVGRPAARPPGM
jgi:hypothetical protein